MPDQVDDIIKSQLDSAQKELDSLNDMNNGAVGLAMGVKGSVTSEATLRAVRNLVIHREELGPDVPAEVGINGPGATTTKYKVPLDNWTTFVETHDTTPDGVTSIQLVVEKKG